MEDEGEIMDVMGLALAVITVLFLCWVLAPSRRRAEIVTDPSSRTEESPLVTGSSPR